MTERINDLMNVDDSLDHRSKGMILAGPRWTGPLKVPTAIFPPAIFVLLMIVLCLGCNRAEEARREAVRNNLKQIGLALRKYHETYTAAVPKFSHVIADESEYYTSGPQQMGPPDGRFPTGTWVSIVEQAGGYARVKSVGGIEAYVAADAIKQQDDTARHVCEIVDGSNQFALDLYQQLRTDQGNLFYSPFSISTALAMTSAGAAGDTAAEFAKTLHFQLPQDQLHEGIKVMQTFATMPDNSTGIRLDLANRLWGQESYEFLPAFLQVTRDCYGAELARLDFAHAEDTSKAINEWVAAQTEGQITDLISSDALSPVTRLVLTNAVYFQGKWAGPFDMEQTRHEEFHVTATEKIKVPMMHRSDKFRYGSVDGLQILELPYGNGSLSMLVLLPATSDGLAELEAKMSFQNMQRWTASMKQETEVQVSLPKFKTTSHFDLSDTLEKMGLASAFDRIEADFSRMTTGRELFISAVIHQAFVDVNEEATEAAAATGVIMGIRGIPAVPPVFRADHPFVFMIRDNRNGAILFLGRITNPRE